MVKSCLLFCGIFLGSIAIAQKDISSEAIANFLDA